MQIGVSKEEFEVHLLSAKHQRNINARDLSSLSSSAETVFSVPSVSLETNGECEERGKCVENQCRNGVPDAPINSDVGSTRSARSQDHTIAVTDSSRRNKFAKNASIDGLVYTMTNCSQRIPEESVAFIETNIPFADPVISGIFFSHKDEDLHDTSTKTVLNLPFRWNREWTLISLSRNYNNMYSNFRLDL